MPIPSRFDDRFHVGVGRSPTQSLSRQARVGDQFRRVTRATRTHRFRDRVTGNFATRLDDLANARSPAGPQVQAQTFSRLQTFERPQVSITQIVDVDVVTDTGSVRRGVVIAENGDFVALPQCDLQHDRYQVRLGIVVLADRSVGSRPAALKYRSAA